MSKKFFRPPPQAFEDDDDDDDESEEDEVEENTGRSKTNNANINLSDDEEEEEDEEDEDEIEESRKRKKGGKRPPPKKKARGTFFDEEAEASDDDEEEENDGEQMDEEARRIMEQQDRRRAAQNLFNERSVAEISQEIELRHRQQHRTVDRSSLVVDDARNNDTGYTAAVAQQSLVPSISDPNLWMVSCSTGKEQELVLQIMNKAKALARQGRPLGICSVIAAQSKGKIYVESYSEPAVLEAIQNVRGLLFGTMKLVPISDMTTVLTVMPKKKPVQNNEWVRMTRGHYKGDLALVKAVKESGLKCIVQFVPRLDLVSSDLPPEEARIRRRTVRPPQKFFNAQEIAALGRQSLRRQRFPGLDIYCDYFESNYYHDGYLLKEMTVGSMVKPCTDEDPPTLDELQSFQKRRTDDGVEDNEASSLAKSLIEEISRLGQTGLTRSSGNSGLTIGDTIEVMEGDLIGMRGKLITLDGNTVKVQPNNVDVGEVEFLVSQVRKYIAVGAHVKVTDGRYANETGVVVAVEQADGETDSTAVVLTDVTNKEISVRTSQLHESADISSGQETLQGYELYDLVVLSGGGSANEVGVIVRVGREDFTVINNHGIAREVRPEELRGKLNSRSARAVALDVQGNQIRSGDSVNVAEGPHKGKTATVKRMNRAQLFLHSQTRAEHAGIFVVRSRSCVLAGSRSQNRNAGIEGGESPFRTPISQSSGGPAGGRGRKTDDGLIGKTVRIQAGPWKGYIGTVADTTATHVQVELHSRLKKVMVVRERVTVVGDKFGATENPISAAAGGPVAPVTAAVMATPMHAIGGATPGIHGFGGATPAHDPDNADEVWRPGGSVDEAIKEDDGWGASQSSPTNDDNDVWGSGGGSSWGAPAQKKEETNSQPMDEGSVQPSQKIKREQPKHEMETEDNELEETPVWFMERVCVQLKDNDKMATIKEINADKSALIEIEDDKTTRTVRVAEISMVSPVEHDTVLVTGGNEIGLEGSLVCVDGNDAILKDANDEFKIIDFVHLVKIASES